VPDDIITVGAPGRRYRRDADASIESLFHTHYPHVVYTAFGLVGDWDLAEQLAQEAYLRLWRRWRLLADPQAAPSYLQRIVVNLSRETIRRRIIERRALKVRSMERPPATGPDLAAHLELRRAIAALPARKRECIVMRYLLGLSEAETASLLEVSVGTIKSQTHKGLRQLRALLDDMAAPADVSATGEMSAAGSATKPVSAAGSATKPVSAATGPDSAATGPDSAATGPDSPATKPKRTAP